VRTVEHREIVHQCGLIHDTVHFLCLDSAGHYFLQRRSHLAGRNPGRWTSTVSGHVEAQDEGSHKNALEREIEEELGDQALLSIGNIEYVGHVTCVSQNIVRIGVHSHSHICNSVAHLYVGKSDKLLWKPTQEIEEVAVFDGDTIESAMRNKTFLKLYPMADNFPIVYSMYRSKLK